LAILRSNLQIRSQIAETDGKPVRDLKREPNFKDVREVGVTRP